MKNWVLRTKKADFNALATKHKISNILARIMINRDVKEDEFESFLKCDEKSLNSPFLLKDIDKAISIIKTGIADGKKIRIVGDYDIDGVCATYILLTGLRRMGAMVDYYIPDRVKDGYGINENIVKKAIEDKVEIIVTCDNGISAVGAVQYAKDNGLQFVLTDHHHVPFNLVEDKKEYILPNADAIVNHQREDCEYPFKHLCGAAVAYKLIEAMEALDEKGYSLMCAGIATVGDIMDLCGENRTIVKKALEIINTTSHIGISALIKATGLVKGDITAYQIGFVLGPCINASGRLVSAEPALELLLCEDEEKAQALAKELVELNVQRKQLTEEATNRAKEIAAQTEDDVLVIYLKDCHESIAGIIAGRVKEAFYKPTFVFTDSGEMIKGSGRSVEGYNMVERITECKEHIAKFGGHSMAAGLSVENEEKLNILRKALNENFKRDNLELIEKIKIDMQLPFNYANFRLVEELSVLEPFGKGNEKPIFAAKDVRIDRVNIIGKNRNVIKLEMRDDSNTRVNGVLFNKTDEFVDYITQKFGKEEFDKALRTMDNNIRLMITFYPDINTYNGVSSMQLIIGNYK